MDKVLNLALMVLSEMQTAERRRDIGPRTTRASAACMVLAAIMIVAAIGCAVAAVWIYLAFTYSALAAAVGTAVALGAAAGLLVVLSKSAREERAVQSAKPSIGDDLMSDLTKTFQHNKGAALLAALLAGVAAGNQTK